MEIFTLPAGSRVDRVVPKNAFDEYTNSRQKDLFKQTIEKIRWSHKLAPETTNLQPGVLQELQLFTIELRQKFRIEDVLEIIDRAIPYTILFVVHDKESYFLSTSVKHPHPQDSKRSVIDWTFSCAWHSLDELPYALNLKATIDNVYFDICRQLSLLPEVCYSDLSHLVEYNKEMAGLQKEIATLKSAVIREKQFNKRVELNIEINRVERLIQRMLRVE
jgi:hypothetical protein